jgi:lysosomal alpha-mannosidase
MTPSFFQFGSDFWYSNANIPFTSMDRLINAMNKKTNKTGFNVFYSTPACYASSLTQNPPKLPVRDGDHFPYASGDHSYWTGYFTSKPAMKRMVRQASGLLHMARTMRAFANLTDEEAQAVEEKLERAVGLAQVSFLNQNKLT